MKRLFFWSDVIAIFQLKFAMVEAIRAAYSEQRGEGQPSHGCFQQELGKPRRAASIEDILLRPVSELFGGEPPVA